MVSMYSALLQDPSGDTLSEYCGISDTLGTMDVITSELRRSEKMDTTLSNANVTLCALEEYLRSNKFDIDLDMQKFIGLEFSDTAKIIIDIVTSIFKTLYEFISKLIKFIIRIADQIVSVDTKVHVRADMLSNQLSKLYHESSSDEKKAMNDIVKTVIMMQMCSKNEFESLMKDFGYIFTTTKNWINSDIPKTIDNIYKELFYSPSLNVDNMREKLTKLGITVKETKIAYESPFADYPDAGLNELQFHTIEDILTVSAEYNKQIWGSTSTIWYSLAKQLDRFQDKLKSKEKELSRFTTVDKVTLSHNAKHLEKQMTLALGILANLRQANMSFNSRRRELCIVGLKAYRQVTSSTRTSTTP